MQYEVLLTQDTVRNLKERRSEPRPKGVGPIVELTIKARITGTTGSRQEPLSQRSRGHGTAIGSPSR